MAAVRCPQCGRYGSADLGGYCKTCKASRRKPNYVKRDFMKKDYGFKTGSGMHKNYGIMRDKPMIVKKGE